MSFYKELVVLGGGLMKRKFMLPPGSNISKTVSIFYEHIDDPACIEKQMTFVSWCQNPIDLPGRCYLQVIT